MINRLIIKLLRRKHKLNKNQLFQFSNQKDKTEKYYFTSDRIIKITSNNHKTLANVSLSWLLNDKCKIDKLNEYA